MSSAVIMSEGSERKKWAWPELSKLRSVTVGQPGVRGLVNSFLLLLLFLFPKIYCLHSCFFLLLLLSSFLLLSSSLATPSPPLPHIPLPPLLVPTSLFSSSSSSSKLVPPDLFSTVLLSRLLLPLLLPLVVWEIQGFLDSFLCCCPGSKPLPLGMPASPPASLVWHLLEDGGPTEVLGLLMPTV